MENHFIKTKILFWKITIIEMIPAKLLLLLNLGYFALAVEIEQVDDTDLVHLLTQEDNVIALFTKTNCAQCTELEKSVEKIENELKDSLKAIVVKAHNSNMIGIYDPTKEPALVYFRKGIPLLYYGSTKGDDIMQMFIENREPVVKELSDENFEHLTQASSGATTGNWFIFFYSADCVFCQRLYAVWESVGANLRHHTTVARINRLGAGIGTAKRFKITTSPEFIFLRHGKVYRYKLKDYTPKSFIDFAEDGYYKQSSAEAVPQLSSFTDNVAERFLTLWISRRMFVLTGLALLSVAAIVALKRILKPQKAAKEQKQK